MIALVAVFVLSARSYADEPGDIVKRAVERCTLNQARTKPFHLKAVLAPSLDRDRGSNRTGEVEYWWASPTQWKREVRSPEFHQVAIVNGDKEWQKNEGDYFPEWLRETSVALIEPVPSLDEILKQVEEADVHKLMGTTHFSWIMMSTDGSVQKGMGAGLDVTSAGLVQGGSGLGWSGWYRDHKDFHGRMVARTVGVGTPEVSAKVTTLEDLRDVAADFFDASVSGGDAVLLRTAVVDEITLRENLMPTEAVVWPAVQDGPLEGVITTRIVVDRTGKVRELGSILSDNPALSEAAGKTIGSMSFQPYLQNGVAVQVVSRITMPFKAVRPPGVEALESARTYFERGRQISFPAVGSGPGYVLRATFQVRVEGKVEEGQYLDTWKSDDEWRREATIGKSRYVRARHGETRYQLLDGPDSGVSVLRLVLKAMEPIPALDTFVESDWRMKRDTVDGVKTIRVLAGYESSEGVLDPEHARGYWFDESGKLVKTYFRGIETRRFQFEEFGGVQIAHDIRVLHNDGIVMLIRVTEVSAAGTVPESTFELHGHEWKRAFTDEVR
jgi:Gram-negative bacterial TonB protein C-terminal